MPLPPASKTTRSSDIAELIRSFKRKGTIGPTRPKSMGKALDIASAIAYKRHPGSKGK